MEPLIFKSQGILFSNAFIIHSLEDFYAPLAKEKAKAEAQIINVK